LVLLITYLLDTRTKTFLLLHATFLCFIIYRYNYIRYFSIIDN